MISLEKEKRDILAEAGDLNREVGTTRDELQELEGKLMEASKGRAELQRMFSEQMERKEESLKDIQERLEEASKREQKLLASVADLRGELHETTRSLKEARKEVRRNKRNEQEGCVCEYAEGRGCIEIHAREGGRERERERESIQETLY